MTLLSVDNKWASSVTIYKLFYDIWKQMLKINKKNVFDYAEDIQMDVFHLYYY